MITSLVPRPLPQKELEHNTGLRGKASREAITVESAEGSHPDTHTFSLLLLTLVSVRRFRGFYYALTSLSSCNSEVTTAVVHFTWLAAPVRGIRLDSGKSSC